MTVYIHRIEQCNQYCLQTVDGIHGSSPQDVLPCIQEAESSGSCQPVPKGKLDSDDQVHQFQCWCTWSINVYIIKNTFINSQLIN